MVEIIKNHLFFPFAEAFKIFPNQEIFISCQRAISLNLLASFSDGNHTCKLSKVKFWYDFEYKL